MNEMRSLIITGIFATVAVLSNWSVTVKSDRPNGEIESKISVEGIPLLIALLVVPVLVYQIHRLLREFLAGGVVIPRMVKFVDWRPCLLLFPLLVHWSDTSTGIAADGAAFSRTFSYGSDTTVAALASVLLCIVLCQIYSSLTHFGAKATAGDTVRP